MKLHRTNPTVLLLLLALPGCEIGNRDEGDSCACSKQCAEGLYCTEDEQPSEVDGTCGQGNGQCTAYAQKGEACSEAEGGQRCDAPLICLPFEHHVCGDRLADGEACDPQQHGQCADGLSCNVAVDPPECRAPGGTGEPCASEFDCGSALTCNVGFEPAQCEPVGSSQAGEPCGEDADCTSGLLCNSGAEPPLCIAPMSQPPGASCNQDAHCASGHCVTWSGGQSGVWIGECS